MSRFLVGVGALLVLSAGAFASELTDSQSQFRSGVPVVVCGNSYLSDSESDNDGINQNIKKVVSDAKFATLGSPAIAANAGGSRVCVTITSKTR